MHLSLCRRIVPSTTIFTIYTSRNRAASSSRGTVSLTHRHKYTFSTYMFSFKQYLKHLQPFLPSLVLMRYEDPFRDGPTHTGFPPALPFIQICHWCRVKMLTEIEQGRPNQQVLWHNYLACAAVCKVDNTKDERAAVSAGYFPFSRHSTVHQVSFIAKVLIESLFSVKILLS